MKNLIASCTTALVEAIDQAEHYVGKERTFPPHSCPHFDSAISLIRNGRRDITSELREANRMLDRLRARYADDENGLEQDLLDLQYAINNLEDSYDPDDAEYEIEEARTVNDQLRRVGTWFQEKSQTLEQVHNGIIHHPLTYRFARLALFVRRFRLWYWSKVVPMDYTKHPKYHIVGTRTAQADYDAMVRLLELL